MTTENLNDYFLEMHKQVLSNLVNKKYCDLLVLADDRMGDTDTSYDSLWDLIDTSLVTLSCTTKEDNNVYEIKMNVLLDWIKDKITPKNGDDKEALVAWAVNISALTILERNLEERSYIEHIPLEFIENFHLDQGV